MNSKERIVLQDDQMFRTGFVPVLKEKRKLIKLSGKTIRNEYDVTVKLEDGRELEVCTFESLDITYSNHWDACCDATLDRKMKNLLKLHLQQQSADMKWNTCLFVEELGLVVDDAVTFIYGKNAVIREKGELSYMFADNLPNFLCREGVTEVDMIKYATSLICLKPGVTDVLFCASLLCVLRPILLMLHYPADFFLTLYGPSGSLKSTYAKLFFASNSDQMMSFTMDKSRQVLERIAKYSGHAVVVDDYHPAAKAYDRQRQASILDAIARNSDSGRGALAVVTSEFLSGSFSLQDRMVQVHVSKRDLEKSQDETAAFLNKLTDMQQNSDMLQTILYEFAQRVYSDIRPIQIKLSDIIKGKAINDMRSRIGRNVSFLYMAMSIFAYVFPGHDFKQLDYVIGESLNALRDEQVKHMAIVKRLEGNPDWTDEVFRMMDTLWLDKGYEFGKKLQEEKDIIIYDKKTYIKPHVLEAEMQKYLQMNVNIKEISAHLSKTQVLDEDNSAAHSVERSMGNKIIRYYVIDRARLELYHRRNYPDTDSFTKSESKYLVDTIC